MLFDRPLGKFESIRFLIADMATRVEAARLLTYRAAYLRDRGEEFVKEASMAKVFSTETAVWVCERAIQIHGGIGLSKLLPLERYLRDAKVLAGSAWTSSKNASVYSFSITLCPLL